MRNLRKNQIFKAYLLANRFESREAYFGKQTRIEITDEIMDRAMRKIEYEYNNICHIVYQAMNDGIRKAVEAGHTVTLSNDSEPLIKISQKA